MVKTLRGMPGMGWKEKGYGTPGLPVTVRAEWAGTVHREVRAKAKMCQRGCKVPEVQEQRHLSVLGELRKDTECMSCQPLRRASSFLLEGCMSELKCSGTEGIGRLSSFTKCSAYTMSCVRGYKRPFTIFCSCPPEAFYH